MHEPGSSNTWTGSIKAVTLALLVAASASVGVIGFAGMASASLSQASATDVGTGLDSTTQRVTVAGQVTDTDAEVDYYTVSIADLVNNGATVKSVSFSDTQSDGDHLAEGTTVQYNASSKKVTLHVAEGKTDSDNKVTFAVDITFDTRGTTPQRQAKYNVYQYDKPGTERGPSTQGAQFEIYGGTDATANTSSSSGGASPVQHEMQFTMVGDMAPRTVTVRTPGADYSNVGVNDIQQFTVGSTEITDQISSVSGSGDTLTISLGSDQVFENADPVTLVVGNAGNPSSDTTMHVRFANAAEGERFEVDAPLNLSGSSSGGSSGGDSNTGGSSGDDSNTGGSNGGSSGGSGGAGTGGSSGGSSGGSGGGGSGGASTGGGGGGGGGGSYSGGGADTGGSDDDDSSSNQAQDTTTTTSTTTQTTTTQDSDVSFEDTDDTDGSTTTTPTTTPTGSPGFGAVAAVVALGAAFLLVRRRP